MSSGISQVFEDLEPGPPVAPRAASVHALASSPQQHSPVGREPIPFEWAQDFKDAEDDLSEIVEGLLTRGGMSVMYGDSNSGKSYLAVHLSICLTRGQAFLSKRVERGAVIYIAGEGARSVRRRIAAYRVHFGVEDVGPFGLIPTALNLMDPSADVEDLIDLISAKAAEIGEPVLLVVVDTVARAMGGANENASEDMARLVSAGDRIREETGAHVLFIHHSGKNAASGARGHSSLRAALDTEIEVTADEETKTHTAHVTKQRDLATKGARIAGRFIPVTLGHDQWGNAVTACAVEHAEVSSDPKVGFSGPQRAVLGYLAGQDKGVKRARLVEALTRHQGLSRPTAYKAIAQLLQASLLMEVAGMVYLPKG